MRDKKYFTKRCQGIAMAGIIGLMARVPAEIAWAIGPGENNYSISESDMMGPGGIDPRNNRYQSDGISGKSKCMEKVRRHLFDARWFFDYQCAAQRN